MDAGQSINLEITTEEASALYLALGDQINQCNFYISHLKDLEDSTEAMDEVLTLHELATSALSKVSQALSKPLTIPKPDFNKIRDGR
jgi:hypothetical protein